MTLDLCILSVLGLFAAIGFYTGAIQQFSHWIGIIAAYFCAKPAAALLAPALAARMGWPPSLTAVGVSAVSMPVVLIIVTLIARGILNAIIPGKQRNMPDRLTGIFLGAGKAGVIAWAALAAVLVFEEPLVKYLPGAEAVLSASSAAAFTREHSLFELEKSDAPDLLNNPQIKKMLSNPELVKKIESLATRGR